MENIIGVKTKKCSHFWSIGHIHLETTSPSRGHMCPQHIIATWHEVGLLMCWFMFFSWTHILLVGHYQEGWCISDGLELWYYTTTTWVWIILAIWPLEDEQLKKLHFYNNRGSIGSQTRYHQSDCLRSWGILYSIHYIILRSILQCGEGEEWKQHSEGVGKCAKKCRDLQNISNICHITQHIAPGHLQMMSFGLYSLNRLLLCSIPLLTLMECQKCKNVHSTPAWISILQCAWVLTPR